MRRLSWFFILTTALIWIGIAGTSSAQTVAESDATQEVEEDQSITDLITSAESGNVEARYKLGELYLHGLGVPQSNSDARSLFEKASMGGNHAGAQYNLGLMYENGVGVPKSCAQAIEWFRLAAAQNYKDAGEKASRLQTELLASGCEPSSPSSQDAATQQE